MAKVLCVLYDDPVDGMPTSYARDDLPVIEGYGDGQTLPTPKAIDFVPGTLLGSVSGELGLRNYLESNTHQVLLFGYGIGTRPGWRSWKMSNRSTQSARRATATMLMTLSSSPARKRRRCMSPNPYLAASSRVAEK